MKAWELDESGHVDELSVGRDSAALPSRDAFQLIDQRPNPDPPSDKEPSMLASASDTNEVDGAVRTQFADGSYARIAGLPVEIDSCEFVPIVRDTSSGFTKITTVIRLRGGGEEGLGEDVTWDQIDHIEFLRHPMPH